MSDSTGKTRLRRVFRVLIVVVVLLFLLVAFTPMLFGGFLRDALLAGLNEDIPGSIRCRDTSFNWTSGQSIEGLEILDAEGARIVGVTRFQADASLLQLVTGNLDLGKVSVVGLKVDLERDAEGQLNIARAFGVTGAPKKKPPEDSRPIEEVLRELDLRLAPDLRLQFVITDAELSYRDPETEPIRTERVNLACVLEGGGKPVRIDFGSVVRQGDELEGSLGVRGSLTGIDANGVFDPFGAVAELELKADWRSSADGNELVRMLRSLIGDKIAFSARSKMSEKGCEVLLRADAERLEFSALGFAGLFESGAARQFALTRPLKLDWVLDPSVFATEEVSELSSELPVTVRVNSLHVPLEAEHPGDLGARGSLAIGDGRAVLTVGGQREEILWSGWRAEVESESLGKQARLGLNGKLSDGTVKVEASIAGLVNPQGEFDPGGATIQGDATVDKFPLDAVDRLLGRLGGDLRLVDLLGETLDLKGEVRTEADGGLRAHCSVDSRSLKLEAPVRVDFEGNSLRCSGLTGTMSLEPALVNRLMGEEAALRVTSPVKLTLDVPLLEAPVRDFSLDDLVVQLNARSSVDVEKREGGKGLRLSEIRLDVSKPADAKAVLFNGLVKVGEGECKLDGELIPDPMGGTLTLLAKDLPIDSLDGLLGFDGLLVQSFGRRAQARVAFEGDRSKATGEVSADAGELHVLVPYRIENHALLVGTDGSLEMQLSPGLVRRFAKDENAPGLARPVKFSMKTERISFPLPKEGEQLDLSAAAFEATFSATPVGVSGLIEGEQLDVEDLTIDVRGVSLARSQATIRCTVSPGAATGKLRRALGSKLAVDLQSDFGIDGQGNPRQGTLRAKLESTLLKIAVAAQLDESGERIVLAERAATMSYLLKNEVLRELGLLKQGAPDVATQSPLTLEVSELSVPIRAFDVSQVRASIKAGLESATLAGADLKGVRFECTVGEELVLSASGTVRRSIAATEQETGRFTVGARIAGWSNGEPAASPMLLDVTANRIPASLLDKLAGDEERFAGMLGSEVNLTLHADLPSGVRRGGGKQGTWKLDLDSSSAKFNAEGTVGDEVVLNRPVTGRWTLTPRVWQTITKPTDPRLGGLAHMELEVAELRLPLPDRDGGIDASRVVLRTDVNVRRLILTDPEGKSSMTMKGLKLAITARDLRLPVAVQVDGGVEAALKNGSVKGTVQVSGLADPEGRLREGSPAVIANLSLDLIPTAPIDGILGLEGYAQAVFGERLNVIAVTNLERGGDGVMTLKLSSGNAKADIAARLEKGALLLDKPVEAQVTFTEQLGKLVLPKVGPLFQGVESAEQPFTLRIEKQGFKVPVAEGFDIRGVEVGRMRLDVGKVVLRNLWLMDVIQQITRTASKDKLTAAWFSPLDLRMRRGVIHYNKRLDILMQETLHLATDGRIDLGAERLDMTLYFMTETLRKHMSFKNAKDGDHIRLPIKGRVEMPSVKIGHTLGDLAAVRAKREAVDNLGKLPFGGDVLKGALDSLTRELFRQGPLPTASVNPLPWTEEKQKQKEKQQKQQPQKPPR